MIITDISIQARNPNRANVSIDDKYRFSLDLSQVIDFGIKKGKEFDEEKLQELESESEFGKLYMRALEYSLMRPHSAREVRDYLYKKTRASKYKTRKTGEIKEREGVPVALTDRVFERLEQNGHIDDEKFAKFWVESRNQIKGSSLRKLTSELYGKGISNEIIERVLAESERNDSDELAKIITKKRARYTDDQKFMQYLARQGFSFDAIKEALAAEG